MGRPGLEKNRKKLRLDRSLEREFKKAGAVAFMPRAVARGLLELMWEPAYESGSDYLGTAEDIEALVGWTGEPGALTKALVDAGAPEGFGFIEPVTDANAAVTDSNRQSVTRYKIHDLYQNAPEYVGDRRARENERSVEKACLLCGGKFHSSDKRSKFCSSSCRSADYRERHKNGPRDAAEQSSDEPSRSETLAERSETESHSTPAPAPARAPALAPAPAPALARAHVPARSREAGPAVEMPAPLIDGRGLRRHASQHAWCALPNRPNLCIPHGLHEELCAKLGGDPETRNQRAIAIYDEEIAKVGEEPIQETTFVFWNRVIASRLPAPAGPKRSGGVVESTEEQLARIQRGGGRIL